MARVSTGGFGQPGFAGAAVPAESLETQKAMKTRHQILAILSAVLVLSGLRIGQDVYRWYAFEPERMELMRLEENLEAVAMSVIATQIEADSLLGRLEAVDQDLEEARGTLMGETASRRIAGGRLSAYNQQVADRNRLLRRWRTVLLDNHSNTDRYNQLADSIRLVAERMGEAFYPIRSPAEIAYSRQLVPAAAAALAEN